MRKVHEKEVEEIMVTLVTQARAGRMTAFAMHRGVEYAPRTLRCAMQVLTGKEEQRDICSIGLKTVVLEMPQVMAETAVRQLAPKLVSGMAADVNMAPALVGDGAPSARPASDGAPSARPASHRARSAASATLRAQLPGSQPASQRPPRLRACRCDPNPNPNPNPDPQAWPRTRWR